MALHYKDGQIQLHHGDCREVLASLPDCSVDSVVTDPPYELGFMGKSWDGSGIAYSVEMWAEVLRVLKPGGHLCAFGGTRTYHRMACAIEDAGFEIRDSLHWVYGCLDEQTLVATIDGEKHYRDTTIGDLVLCYDVETSTYSYQPILEVVEYDYSDTAYRLVGDCVEQVVTRNHRCIVERSGGEVFHYAETLESEARVPVLESLSRLRRAFHDAEPHTGAQEQTVRSGVHLATSSANSERKSEADRSAQGASYRLPSVRRGGMEARGMVAQDKSSSVLQTLQRETSLCGVGQTFPQGPSELVGRIEGGATRAHDGRYKSVVEGWRDLSQAQGRVRRSVDQIRALSRRVLSHVATGWICHGTQIEGGASAREAVDKDGVRASREPRRNGQPNQEPHAVCNERGTQKVRAWSGHQSHLVRVVPFHYTGKVWCLRVPTGAFVAVRNGVAFPTGNSGFPKSLDVSKAIDKAAGAERIERVDPRWIDRYPNGNGGNHNRGPNGIYGATESILGRPLTTSDPATDAAKQWEGWGTALKPAHEPIVLARKPLIGTVAANVLTHGTGALNIDGTRVASGDDYHDLQVTQGGDHFSVGSTAKTRGTTFQPSTGRWPANVIFDTEAGALLDEQTDDASRFFTAIDWHPEIDVPFRYVPKPSKRERTCEGTVANGHPTLKPLALMRWLVKLVTPPGGTVLEPFAGSGTTLMACVMEGLNGIGIELTDEYLPIIEGRVKWAHDNQPTQEQLPL